MPPAVEFRASKSVCGRSKQTRLARFIPMTEGSSGATDLPVSSYEVRIEDERFVPYLHTGVAIGVGTTAHLDVVLQAAGVTTQVTVSAQPPPIDPARLLSLLPSTGKRSRICPCAAVTP